MTKNITSYEHARDHYLVAMHALVEAYSSDSVRACIMANEARETISQLESKFPQLADELAA